MKLVLTREEVSIIVEALDNWPATDSKARGTQWELADQLAKLLAKEPKERKS